MWYNVPSVVIFKCAVIFNVFPSMGEGDVGDVLAGTHAFAVCGKHAKDMLAYTYNTCAYTHNTPADLHACMHACTHTHIHTHTYIHPYIHAYMHTYIHIYVHTYTHAHTAGKRLVEHSRCCSYSMKQVC